jgi:hypothetical protein
MVGARAPGVVFSETESQVFIGKFMFIPHFVFFKPFTVIDQRSNGAQSIIIAPQKKELGKLG